MCNAYTLDVSLVCFHPCTLVNKLGVTPTELQP